MELGFCETIQPTRFFFPFERKDLHMQIERNTNNILWSGRITLCLFPYCRCASKRILGQ